MVLAIAVATRETRRAWAYMSGAQAFIIAISAPRAEHPCTPATSGPAGGVDSEEIAGFTRAGIIEGGIGSRGRSLESGRRGVGLWELRLWELEFDTDRAH